MNPRDAESYLEFAYRTAIAAGDAILPHFRGRAPTNWAVVKGATNTHPEWLALL